MRNAPPQVAQVRSTDCAARRQARPQNCCRLLGGAGKSLPQCWQVSRFRSAERVRWPLSSAGRAAHARHRVAGLSARTSSSLPHAVQIRRRVARFRDLAHGATAPVLAAVPCARIMQVPVDGLSASPGWMPAAYGFRMPRWTPSGVQRRPGYPAQRPAFIGVCAGSDGPGFRVASQKSGPVAGDAPRFARQHTNVARKEPEIIGLGGWTPAGPSAGPRKPQASASKQRGERSLRRTLPILPSE